MDTEWEARLAVELASDKLASMPNAKRSAWAFAGLSLLLGASFLVVGSVFAAAVLLIISIVAAVVGTALLTRVTQPRLERARQLNAEVVARREAP